jgi:hypothetical protein
VAGLENQGFKHQYVIEGRATAFRAVRARHRPLQVGAEQFKIDHRAQPFQAVTFGRELLQPFVDIKNPGCPAMPIPPPPGSADSGRKTISFWKSPAGERPSGLAGYQFIAKSPYGLLDAGMVGLARRSFTVRIHN